MVFCEAFNRHILRLLVRRKTVAKISFIRYVDLLVVDYTAFIETRFLLVGPQNVGWRSDKSIIVVISGFDYMNVRQSVFRACQDASNLRTHHW